MDYKKLWINLLTILEEGQQTNWGKHQITEKMKQMELTEARKDGKNDPR
ncbi:hypothetical protein ES707_22692 [subsurface metagenome]